MKQYLGCLMILQAEHFYDSCEAMFKITYFKLPLRTDAQIYNANSRIALRQKSFNQRPEARGKEPKNQSNNDLH